MNWCRRLIVALCCSFVFSAEAAEKLAYVLPVKEDIMTPLAYLIRRGVKEAMKANADVLILDMDTNGGRLDATQEIIESLGQFKGMTVTYVDRKAFSAGAIIAIATQKIYMSPQSVIGAAAPIMMGPGGGVQEMPSTVEVKMTSAVRSMVRTSAEKNGYNIQVVEAMIDKSREVKIDDEVLNEKGQILTLTNVQAEKNYGSPPKPLLSSGTVDSLDKLLEEIGFSGARRVTVQATGAEKLASLITAISPLLLLIGIVAVYIEMKTPGFGLPGIVGICAFVLYFVGSYIAGLSGLEWLVVFFLGLACFILELFLFPGTLALGVLGATLMLASLVMAMVDMYPGMPPVPSFPQLQMPLLNVLTTMAVAAVVIVVLSRYLLTTPLFHRLVSQTASGERSTQKTIVEQSTRLGQVGTSISPLRPGGKAQFGSEILDVVSEGEMIAKGRQVKIVGFSGREPIVAAAEA
jgi:membrane-bound serine protease (ClpP class)